MNRLIIIGAGGHGKVIADAALKNGYTNICYIDDHATGDVMGFPIIGTSADIERLNDGSTDFIIGIGNNAMFANRRTNVNDSVRHNNGAFADFGIECDLC